MPDQHRFVKAGRKETPLRRTPPDPEELKFLPSGNGRKLEVKVWDLGFREWASGFRGKVAWVKGAPLKVLLAYT